MKKFLEELAKSKEIDEKKEKNPECKKLYKDLREKFTKLIGSRALLKNSQEKQYRIVRIKECCEYFIVVTFISYSLEFVNENTICLSYQALLCQDVILEVEKDGCF